MTTQTATAAAQPIPVYVAGNTTVHAGRQVGSYESGQPRYRKLCSGAGRDNHDPMPGTPGETVITCKRCLAKLGKLAARAAQAAREATPFQTETTTEETTVSESTTPEPVIAVTESGAEQIERATGGKVTADAVKTEAKQRATRSEKATAKRVEAHIAEATAEPAIEPAKLVEQVAKATRLRGLTVEPRQGGKRHVITITDDAGTRILAYVDPLRRGTGFRVLVQNYGGETAQTVETPAEAAELVKGSERRKPKAKQPAAKKPAAETR
jgi:DNA-binding transcriptional regulator YdaS (Cro superfamily)